MASQQVNEIDEIINNIKKTPGFNAYLILNNDGVVLRWEQVKSNNNNSKTTNNSGSGRSNNMSGSSTTADGNSNNDEDQASSSQRQYFEQPPLTYEKAVQYSHHILELCSKSQDNMKELYGRSDNGSNGCTGGEGDNHHHNHSNNGNSYTIGGDRADYEVESIRVRTDSHELIIAQEGNYILAVIYVGKANHNAANFK